MPQDDGIPSSSRYAFRSVAEINFALEYYNTGLSQVHNSLLIDIATRITQPKHRDIPTYLFVMAYIHVKNLLGINFDLAQSTGFAALLRELRSCKDRFKDADIRRIQETWGVGGISWDFMDRYISTHPVDEEPPGPTYPAPQAASSNRSAVFTSNIGSRGSPKGKDRQDVDMDAEFPVDGVNSRMDDLALVNGKTIEENSRWKGISNSNSGDPPFNP
ncbi:hypothetical protein CPB83DRAFT_517821 [Crepidotus variabilis]|uniref:Uncharacterized protein n=1 Tax=Crepidotus variabilis TaxID=179855 RepID=A0A9P6JMD6_9AGAR|nr:hypothetical protein CPB83DRAFT_517821 [Crepidotus variabilis]